MIGVVIAALSIGYFVGGKLADSRHKLMDIAYLCLLTAATVVLVLIIYQPVLTAIGDIDADRRAQALLASLLLFAPASFLLGAISPYLAKFAVRSLATTARSIASLSALNSIGGIVGTFVSGFILFGYIGSRETLVVVIVLLLASSWLVMPAKDTMRRVIITVVTLITALLASQPSSMVTAIDTASAHYQIVEGYISDEERPIRALLTGPSGAQSGVLADGSKGLVFWYIRELAEVTERAANKNNILVLGGGTFTLPQYLAETYPQSQVDVVEIDEGLEAIAREYFYFDPPSNLNIIFDDARGYLNATDRQYDVILVDVYSDMSVPFSLLTREYGDKLAARLAPDGLVAINAIAATSGPCQTLLAAIDAPYSRHWSQAMYATESDQPTGDRSNMILVYGDDLPGMSSVYKPLNIFGSAIYTDNFMPAERLQQACSK